MARLPFAAPDPASDAGKLLAALPLNVARVMAHSPAVMVAFQRMGGAILNKTDLPAPLRELAILRVGHLRAAAYEVHHHERIGRAVGMSEAQLRAARFGADAACSDDDRLVLAVAEAVEAGGGLEEPLFGAALARFGARELVELVLAAGFYGMVSRFLVAFQIEPETEDLTLPGVG